MHEPPHASKDVLVRPASSLVEVAVVVNQFTHIVVSWQLL